MNKNIISSIIYILKIYVLSLFVFSLYRIGEYLLIGAEMMTEAANEVNKLQAFINGIQFDSIICSYILLLPIIILLFTSILGKIGHKTIRGISIFTILAFLLCFAPTAANTPYYSYFSNNINSSILIYAQNLGTVTEMLVEEQSYLMYIIEYFIIAAIYIFLAVKFRKRFQHQIEINQIQKQERINNKTVKKDNVSLNVAIVVLALALCFIGVRGRVTSHPLRASEAYYSEDIFLNQLGINPAYSFIKSVLNNNNKYGKELKYVPVEEAFKYVKNRIENTSKGKINSENCKIKVEFIDSLKHINPIHRKISYNNNEEIKKKNVVIILIESLSANLMTSFGQKRSMTPFLDSLYNNSLAFSNCYSCAVHTFAGILGTIYSVPTIFGRNYMKNIVTPKVNGLPKILSSYDYKNMFFLAHEPSFDNMNAFLKQNNFDEVYSMLDYPADKQVNSWGVSDDFLFEFALNKLNKNFKLQCENKTKQPIFATILTMSNHPPYVVPEYFKSKSKFDDIIPQITEYTDYCVGEFLKKAKLEPWYDDTIFIILADHGKLVDEPNCELPRSYNHIPLIILNSGYENQIVNKMSSQIDIMPTLLSIMNMPYEYDGIGIDLTSQEKDMVFYCNDDKLVGRDSSICSIMIPNINKSFNYFDNGMGSISKIKLENISTTDSGASDDAKEIELRLKELNKYSLNMLQITDYIQRHIYGVNPKLLKETL